MRWILSIVLFLVWLWLGYFYYQSASCDCHLNTTSENTEILSVTPESDIHGQNADHMKEPRTDMVKEPPLQFKFNEAIPIIGNGWLALKDSLKKGLSTEDKLRINGQYHEDEKNNTNFANLGLARANATRNALGLSGEQVILVGTKVNALFPNKNAFEAIRFTKTSTQVSVDINTYDHKTLIHFPYNSTDKLSDEAVETYLIAIAERVNETGENIRLTGHTDASGSAEYNMELGLKRANIIRDFLIKQGVSPSQIITISMGQTMPIASNKTGPGREENRRTELELYK